MRERKPYDGIKKLLYEIFLGEGMGELYRRFGEKGMEEGEIRRLIDDMELTESEKEGLINKPSKFFNIFLKDCKMARAKYSKEEIEADLNEFLDGVNAYRKEGGVYEEVVDYAIKRKMDMFGVNKKTATRWTVTDALLEDELDRVVVVLRESLQEYNS